MNHSATILLPTYNEADNIVPLLRALLELLPNQVTFLVVDDQSPDGTALRVETFIQHAKTKRVRLLVRRERPGLTNSLLDGVAATKTQAVGWMDCDFSHPPEVMSKLYDAYVKGGDLTIATRFKTGGKQKSGESVTGAKLSSIINRLCQFFFGNDVTDYTTGFLIAKTSVVRSLPLRGSYGEYCIDFLVRAKRNGYRIQEIPFVSPPRRFGSSKTAPNIKVLLIRSIGYAGTFFRLLTHQ